MSGGLWDLRSQCSWLQGVASCYQKSHHYRALAAGLQEQWCADRICPPIGYQQSISVGTLNRKMSALSSRGKERCMFPHLSHICYGCNVSPSFEMAWLQTIQLHFLSSTWKKPHQNNTSQPDCRSSCTPKCACLSMNIYTNEQWRESPPNPAGCLGGCPGDHMVLGARVHGQHFKNPRCRHLPPKNQANRQRGPGAASSDSQTAFWRLQRDISTTYFGFSDKNWK